jgi:hypothetical protein
VELLWCAGVDCFGPKGLDENSRIRSVWRHGKHLRTKATPTQPFDNEDDDEDENEYAGALVAASQS